MTREGEKMTKRELELRLKKFEKDIEEKMEQKIRDLIYEETAGDFREHGDTIWEVSVVAKNAEDAASEVQYELDNLKEELEDKQVIDRD